MLTMRSTSHSAGLMEILSEGRARLIDGIALLQRSSRSLPPRLSFSHATIFPSLPNISASILLNFVQMTFEPFFTLPRATASTSSSVVAFVIAIASTARDTSMLSISSFASVLSPATGSIFIIPLMLSFASPLLSSRSPLISPFSLAVGAL